MADVKEKDEISCKNNLFYKIRIFGSVTFLNLLSENYFCEYIILIVLNTIKDNCRQKLGYLYSFEEVYDFAAENIEGAG